MPSPPRGTRNQSINLPRGDDNLLPSPPATLTVTPRRGVIPPVSSAPSNQRAPNVNTLLCVGREAFDHFAAVLRHLIVGLIDQAIPLRVVSGDPRAKTLSLGPVQVISIPRRSWPTPARPIRNFLDTLSTQPPTIVHATSHSSYALAAAVADEFDAELILQVTSLADCEAVPRFVARASTHFHSFSKPLAAILETQLRILPENIEVVPPGFPASPKAACFAHAERVPTLLCTSPFDRHSGVDRLIAALEILIRRGHALQCFLSGDGSYEPALRKLVRAKHLSDHVTFAPVLHDPAPAFQSADLFVRPSLDTAFVADTLQAMSAGLLVLTPANEACDHLWNNETAVICPSNQIEDLADAIEKPLRDRPEAQRIAAAALDYVRRNHGISAMAEKTAAAYRTLALARTTFALRE